MIDAQITRATCEVKCGSQTGTGWLVTASRVVSARHAVEDALVKGERVRVRFDLEASSRELAARVVAEDETLDVCILQLEEEMDIPAIPLSETLPAEGNRFSAFGFPVAKLAVGHRLEGSISRVLDVPRLGIDLDLHVDASNSLSDYIGLSGAALICEGVCQGMVRLRIDRSLGGISIARLTSFLKAQSIPIGKEPATEPDDKIAPRDAFTRAFDALVRGVDGGYALVEGAHGIGKSTFCENYDPFDQALEHFGTYSFTSDTQLANAMHLAQPEVFFAWVNTLIPSYLTGKPGRTSEKTYSQMIVEVKALLRHLGEAYSSQGKIGVIFIDGLDAAAKLGQGTIERFVGLLPNRMPDGLVCVLSAPSYTNLSAVLGERIGANSCISMPPFTRDAARAFCANALLPDRSNVTTIGIICERAEGHPLYLRYLIDLANGGTDDDRLTALPLIDGRIQKYYETLWSGLQDDADAVNLLAIVARLRWGIPTQQLAQMLSGGEQVVLVTTLARIQHLLLRPGETAIYHSSFADFLVEKTTLRELDVQERLSQYCLGHPEARYGTLNVLYHGLRCGLAKLSAIAICKQDWIDRCVTLGAEPDVLLGDVEEALEEATGQGSLVDVVRILLLSQRLRFRYNTLFAESADLAADALLALGKTQEVLQHAVRYGQLIIPMPQALSLAYKLIALDQGTAALDLLDHADAQIDRQLSMKDLTVSNFIVLFELRIHLLILRSTAGDEDATQALISFYMSSIRAIENSISDEIVCKKKKTEMAGYFGASMACLALKYVPVSALRERFGQSLGSLELILMQLLANYQFLCQHYRKLPDAGLLASISTDLQGILEELKSDWERPDLGTLDAIVTLGAPVHLVRVLSDQEFDELGPLAFVATDNVSMDGRAFAIGMARWRLASLLTPDLACPPTEEVNAARWKASVDSICRALAWCDGTARRAKDSDDKAGLRAAWSLLEQRVFDRLQFSLPQRVKWDKSYAIPEAVFPQIYERLARLVADVFPERMGDLLRFIASQFSAQCGLYSEGFRSVLASVLSLVSELTLDAAVGDEAFALLLRWRNFVQTNVKNRHELVPELLEIIPLLTRLGAAEEAHRTYSTVLAFSMGPSWYKEDQLSLLTGTLERIPQGEALAPGVLSRVAGLLEEASGEMTFQRFIRYDKASLVGVLCERQDYFNAARYFMRQTCGTAVQLHKEATEGEIDRTAPLRGMRFPGGALDEQDVVCTIVESATAAAHWPLCWVLLEIYQFGDRRHLSKFATTYAHLLEQAHAENADNEGMTSRLKVICESEIEADEAPEFVASLRRRLPAQLQKTFAEALEEMPGLVEVDTAPETADAAPPVAAATAGQANGAVSDDDSAREILYLPGTFGTSDSTRQADEALAQAEMQLARGNVTGARSDALAALTHLQRGGWSIWGSLSRTATRAEDILLHQADSAATVVRLYASLILEERYAQKWRCADHLIERIAHVATGSERAALVQLVVEHVEIMVGNVSAKVVEYEFLEEVHTSDASASLMLLLRHAVDHPRWLRREKAAEMVLWLLERFPQYVPTFGPSAFSMDSGNFPDVVCGVLDHLSVSDAALLWRRLEPALDLRRILEDCKHVGRLAVLIRIADRAARNGSVNAVAALERLRLSIERSTDVVGDAETAEADCPAWATIAAREWRELRAMGLATQGLVERATTAMRDACSPLSIEIKGDLEKLLAEGFRDNQPYLGRWKAQVRYALQVAVRPVASEVVLTRIERIFRPYNPAQIGHLRITGFVSPTIDWMSALEEQRAVGTPGRGDDVYLDLFERIWDEDRYRLFRMTAFFYRLNTDAALSTKFTRFFSTEQPSSSTTSQLETCVGVEWKPALFGSFTPAVPSFALAQMTGAAATDLTRAHWRTGRTPEFSGGGGPEHEGCYLAIRRDALRIPGGVGLAWAFEIDGVSSGVLTSRH